MIFQLIPRTIEFSKESAALHPGDLVPLVGPLVECIFGLNTSSYTYRFVFQEENESIEIEHRITS